MADALRAAAVRGEQPDSGASGRVLTVLLTSVAYFMVALDTLVVVTALPSIHRDLGGNVGTLQWTVNAYVLTFGATIITAAALGDLIGRRRMYVLGLVVFTAASAACALAPNIGVLIACRAVEGAGAGIIMPLGLTLLTSAFPVERRGAVIGIWGGVAGLAVASGPLIGGAVTQGLNWHWIFWVNVPIGILAAAGSRLRLRESRGPARRLDLPALVLVAAGIGALTWGLVQAGQAGWGSAQAIIALCLGAASIAGFIAWEKRAAEPMIPLGLFRSASFSAAVATQFLLAAAIYSAAFLTSQFFQFALGDSPLGTGLRFLPWTATPMVIAPIAGAVFDKIGARPLIVPGLLMQAAGFWMDRVPGGPLLRLRQLRRPLRHRRRRDLDGHSVRLRRGPERRQPGSARQGRGRDEHDAAVRRRVRDRDRHDRVQRPRQPGRRGHHHQRLPAGPGFLRGPVGSRSRRRPRHPPRRPGRDSRTRNGQCRRAGPPG